MARPRQISDAQILATMRATVIDHGPRVSLDTVAARLGVTAPALLKRFGNRETLMLEALRPPERPAWADALLTGPREADLELQLLEIFTRIFDFLGEVLPCMTALRESGIPHEKIFANGSTLENCIGSIQHWLDLGRKQGLIEAPETESVAFAMFGAIQSRAFLSHVAQKSFSPRSHQRHLRDLARFFGRALTAAKPQPRPVKRTRNP